MPHGFEILLIGDAESDPDSDDSIDAPHRVIPVGILVSMSGQQVHAECIKYGACATHGPCCTCKPYIRPRYVLLWLLLLSLRVPPARGGYDAQRQQEAA